MGKAATRSVIVTGAAGFLGCETAKVFKAQGFQVAGIGNGTMTMAQTLANGLDYWHEGAVSVEAMRRTIHHFGQPSVVVHAAGGASVHAAHAAPLADFERTVGATAALVEALRILSPETHLMMVSSAAVYGSDHGSPIDEDTRPAPISYYGIHKQMAEQVCQAAAEHWGLKLTIVRLFSIYGAGLRKQIFWDLCNRMSTGSGEIRMGGTGNETRDFLHVSDAARLLVSLGLDPAPSSPEILNGGCGVATSVRNAAESLRDLCGSPVEIEFDGQQREGDPTHLVADVAKIMARGFRPEIPFEKGLADYVAWRQSLRSTDPETRMEEVQSKSTKVPS